MHPGRAFCENRTTERPDSARRSLDRKEHETPATTIRKGRLILCAIVLFLIQVAIAHRLTYRFVRFDLLYLLAAFLALEGSEDGALWSALGIGLLRDLGSSGRLGGSAVLLLLGVAGLVHVRDRIFRETVVTDMLLAFLLVLFCGVGHAMGVALFGRYVQWGMLLVRALGQALITASLYPLLSLVCERIGLLEREEYALG